METAALETFTCDKYRTTMLASGAKEFCAKRYAAAVSGKPLRFDADGCGACSRGKLYHDIKKGDGTMPKKPCTTEGCGRASQKDGLCYKCYKAKHGVAPFASQGGKKGHSSAKNAKSAKKGKGKRTSIVPRPFRGGVLISLDLSKYPALQEYIEEKAREEFRTIEMQAVFMLSKQIEKE